MKQNNATFSRACEVWNMEARSVQRLAETIDVEAFSLVVRRIIECRQKGGRVFVTGKGTSGAAARKVVQNFCFVDIPAIFLSLGEGVHANMVLVKPGDVLILISKGGSAEEVLRYIGPAHDNGATIIGVTQNPASQLAMRSDIMLRVSVEKEVETHNALATASTLATIATFDAIAVAILEGLGGE
jgi:D-arabinose 5-phosphate isomerase GutQ